MSCLLVSQNLNAQNFKIPDSLSKKSYTYLCRASISTKDDTLKARVYANAWLAKSKLQQDWNQIASAYKTIMYFAERNQLPQYADSMLVAAKNSRDNNLIGAAYMKKGIVHYYRKEHIKALNNYILADKYISNSEDKYSQYYLKYLIAQTKQYLGFYDEAIFLYKKCMEYYKVENDRGYLNSLHSLGLCYNGIGNYELCSEINNLGLTTGKEFENLDMASYFIHSEGVNQYFKRNYIESVKKLNQALPAIINNQDFANETVAYFYIGKSYWAQKNQEKAITYFKKVDEAFEKHNYIRPDLREGYELLIEYYENRNDNKLQLYYINRLLKIDQVLNDNYKYLSAKIHKEYDTKKLLEAKQDIEGTMQYRTVVGSIIILIMALGIMFLIYRHSKNKKRFEELMNRKLEGIKVQILHNTNNEKELDINPEVVNAVLKNLEKFERKKKYLEKDMNLVKLASLLNTNTKYVSKIIAKYREKGTIEYISDLKIDHILEQLKNESKYRNYTNKALGEEVGFGSTQNFTRAFNNRTGISPTYFIYQLKNHRCNTSSEACP